MPPKRKTCNLLRPNNTEKANQMSFFAPVYQNDNIQMNDEESGSELSINASSYQKLQNKTKQESTELDDQDQSAEISTSKITARIDQIQNSIEQAKTMLQSMEKFKNLVPGSQEQCEKLYIIIENLEEQQAGYVNLRNLITLTNQEKAALVEKISTAHSSLPANANNQSNDENDDVGDDEVADNDEDEDEDEDDDPLCRRNVRSPVRPRIESKIGFTPQSIIPPTPTVPPIVNSSDNEQNNRNDNSNYDSLVGSLKSDTLNWKDQQLTSGDEASDVESEKEIERNLMLQKEQLRALQGQKRALLALKKRSEKRLIEQQQLINKKTTERNENPSETDLLSDINNLRDRLKLLRNLYDQKHQIEVQEMKNTPKKSPAPVESREKNLKNVREQLNELEQIVTYYQLDLMNQSEEETTVYEETPIQPDDAQRLRALLMQERQKPIAAIPSNDNASKPLDKLSTELAAKRLELEEAKSALNRLQQMVKKIEPDECPSSARSTPRQVSSTKPMATPNTNLYQYTPKASQQTQSTTTANAKNSLLSSILSPNVAELQKPIPSRNSYADAKMAAQHREMERLIESRQRLHTIKDQITSLHQTMSTPPVPSQQDSTNASQLQNPYKNNVKESKQQTNTYADKLNSSKNNRSPYTSNDPEGEGEEDENDDDDSELYRFEYESGDGEEINDDETDDGIQRRIKQGNFHTPEDIVAEHEQRILNKQAESTDELSAQMRDICSCLSTFIKEQKSFNQHIEEHLKAATNVSSQTPVMPNMNDPVFNQLQQQVLTQGLIVNLNTAYREIAVLQSEINSLQIENNRLSSSISSRDDQYQYKSDAYSRDNSKDSIYSLDQIKPIRSRVRSRLDDRVQQDKRLLSATNKFENSSKTSFNSQSTGQQTAIHLTESNMERTPVKHERNTYNGKRLSSPKIVHSRPKPLSDEYEITSNHHRNSTKDNLSKSFIIRRRPISNNNENSLIKSQLFNYDQHLHQEQFNDDDDDDDDDSENEQQTTDHSATILNIQPSAFYRTTTHNFDNIDIQKLHDQIKSVMSQLITFIRLHVNDICSQSILNQIRDRVVYSFKQQPDSAALIHDYHIEFSELIEKTIEKYCGAMIRECVPDLMRDISDVAFDELIKYKIYENTTNMQATNVDEQISEPLIKQQDEYSNMYDSSVLHYAQQTSSVDDGDNDNKYRIELAESENRPLTLIGSDEEDNDSDQEENKDSELETAVSRQDINLNQNEVVSSGELHSNGHEYIIVHHAAHDQNHAAIDNAAPNDTEKTNENQDVADS
ncbi:unnamed protein product [Rotaria magnacalcarata]|uniref:Pericentriolar material 1 protein C-terminal domain-containing protein n=11 Tax=Rotaria magnacalcarata TaxID=392030 RepID=A0A819IQH3_9BILA|nr:unnamed protein product [Rotaria magnacalcarata]CAF3917273.1 unnamed protein product [Rotaria magnacalcarata]